MQQYADLEISLHKADEGMYSVQFRFSQPKSEADTGLGQDKPVWVEIDPDSSTFDPGVLDPDAYATDLTSALFKDEMLRTAFAQARASAQAENLPLRLRLWISASAPELHRLRWELLRDPQDYSPLSTNENIYFSRYFSSMDWRSVQLQQKGNLRALVVVANPSDLGNYKLAPIDLDGELERARAGLAGVSLVELPAGGKPASVDEIISGLRAEGSDILYLVCHGVVANGRAMLYLEGADGKREAVNGDEFALRIKELQKPPRMAVLISCQSAGNGTGDALSALGPRLMEAGIPAVIAMQANLRMDTASQFLPSFFDELQKDGQIDRALAVARGMVRKQPDFWAPVLFMRLKSGRLWYTPGFGDARKGAAKLPAIISNIESGRCTPLIGPGLVEPIIGSMHDIARQWAEQFRYPLSPSERESLPQIAQYLTVQQDDLFPIGELEKILVKQIRTRFAADLPENLRTGRTKLYTLVEALGAKRVQDPNDPFRALAELPLPIYITANQDSLLEIALRAAGREPQVLICPWNDTLAQEQGEFKEKITVERPLVFHLFGMLGNPNSIVLTEDNYFDFLIGVTSNNDIIPTPVRRALNDSSLLFLGFQTQSWDFRVLYRSILSKPGGVRRSKYAQIAAQVEPDDSRILEPQRARTYLEEYFGKGADIDIFWGSAQEFLNELMQLWRSGE